MGFLRTIVFCAILSICVVLTYGRGEECSNHGHKDGHDCVCNHGWEGHHCEHIKCYYGTPEPHRDPTRCVCSDHWTGLHCDSHSSITVIHALSDYCHKHGYHFGHSCVCIHGWTGHHCDTIKCYNGGREAYDHHHSGSLQCLCPDHWTGPHCQHSTNLCLSSPCLHNGKCYHDFNKFWCLCSDGFKGTNCETRENVTTVQSNVGTGGCRSVKCSSSTCRHDGRCYENDSGIYCVCPYPYKGTNCGSMDICGTKPCLNYGHCLNEGNTFYCHCRAGYTGRTCQNHVERTVNGCSSNPCLNNGHCYEDGKLFVCMCKSGFEGHRCETAKSAGVVMTPVLG